MSTTTFRPAPATATASQFTVARIGSAAGKKVRYEIRTAAGPGGDEDTLARAYVRLPPDPPSTHRLRMPPVDVFEGALGDVVCTLQPLHPDGSTESADPRSSTVDGEPHGWELRASDGTLLARIERHPGRLLPWPRRVRWRVSPVGPQAAGEGGTADPDAARSLTGTVGAWYRWVGYALCAPVLWLTLAVVSLCTAQDRPRRLRGPRGVRWRGAGGDAAVALERRAGEDRDGRSGAVYRADHRSLDPRIAYAQAVLVEWGYHCPE